MPRLHHAARIASLGLLCAFVAVVSACSGQDQATSRDAGEKVADAGSEDDSSEMSPDVDGSDTADGSETSYEDTDGDGLEDFEEEALCTDPESADTDGDGLTDLEELQKETDPCAVDTDEDGVDDQREHELDLDPTKESTYDDGTMDGERWFVTACEEMSPKNVEYKRDEGGDWTLGLEPSVAATYSDVTSTGERGSANGATYRDEGVDVAGFIWGEFLLGVANQHGAVDRQAAMHGMFDEAMTVEQHNIGGAYDFGADGEAASGTYVLTTDSEMSVGALRNRLMKLVGTIEESSLPAYDGATATTFRVQVTSVVRPDADGKQAVAMLAVAPESSSSDNTTRIALDDLSGTNQFGRYDAEIDERCDLFRSMGPLPKLDVYVVVDQNSEGTTRETVTEAGEELFSTLELASVNYRVGVTSMQKEKEGRLRESTLWHRDAETFKTELDEYVYDCGDTACEDTESYGLQVAEQGLQRMLTDRPSDLAEGEKVRENATTYVLFISDDSPASLDEGETIADYTSFFKDWATVFSIDWCGDGKTYREVATETGGTSGALCMGGSVSEFFTDWFWSSAGSSRGFVLSRMPVVPSLQMKVADSPVDRSRTDGFEYFSTGNALSFFGSARDVMGPSEDTSFAAVKYESLAR